MISWVPAQPPSESVLNGLLCLAAVNSRAGAVQGGGAAPWISEALRRVSGKRSRCLCILFPGQTWTRQMTRLVLVLVLASAASLLCSLAAADRERPIGCAGLMSCAAVG